MIPKAYQWVPEIPEPPRMIAEALKLVGTVETPGAANSPIIMGWAAEVGLKAVYTADSVPWCGLLASVVAHRAGKPIATSPLWALSWSKWGDAAGQPRFGDVLTFVRPGGGHVALYIGEDDLAYHVLGGNQSDAVGFTRIAKSRLYAARRLYKVMPASAQPHILARAGALSLNEA